MASSTVIIEFLLTIFWDRMMMQGEVVVADMEAGRAQTLSGVMGKDTPIKGGEMSGYVYLFVVFRRVPSLSIKLTTRYKDITRVLP